MYMYQLLILQLKDEIIITGITLEHIPRELTPESSFNSAPKDFSVWVCSLHVYYLYKQIWMYYTSRELFTKITTMPLVLEVKSLL